MRAIADGLLWTECTDSWYGRFVAKVERRLNRLSRWRRVSVSGEAAIATPVTTPDQPEFPRLRLVKPVSTEPVWHPRAFVR